jgi:hypothetical protein
VASTHLVWVRGDQPVSSRIPILLLHFGGNVTVNSNDLASYVDFKGNTCLQIRQNSEITIHLRNSNLLNCLYLFQSIHYEVAYFTFYEYRLTRTFLNPCGKWSHHVVIVLSAIHEDLP